MTERDYYPAGAYEDPNAPYNQSDPDAVDVDVTICQVISRSTTIKVTDYIASPWEEIEPDDDGGFYRTGGVDYDFSDSDLKGAYEEQEFTIPDLLTELKDYIKQDLDNGCSKSKKLWLERMMKACEGWIVDETEVVEN